ncbi:MAG: hypothetical protein ABI748_05540 [Dokdonella sp.]
MLLTVIRSTNLRDLNALAQEHRLNGFRLLVEAGDEGLAVGELAAATVLAGATLTNHLHIFRHPGSDIGAAIRDFRKGVKGDVEDKPAQQLKTDPADDTPAQQRR